MNGIDIENEQLSTMAVKIFEEKNSAVNIMNYLRELRDTAYSIGYKHGKKDYE